ncbi:PQQ-dependent sugar dehydrogenase [Solibacillus silvestris]|uniref:PQQ-dependent sugar dehydrogenase n=1 Tax=Solibacillus silvestris TaxID=76853 RepID=UPI003F7E1107
MKKQIVYAGMAMLLLSGCNTNEKQAEPVLNAEKQIGAVEGQWEVIASKLDAPWAINKLGNIFYMTERTGHIAKVVQNEVMRQEVKLEQALSTASETGLLGFVLAPDFDQSNEAYAYYTYEKGSEQFNRIVLLRLEDNSWHERKVLIDEIPSGTYHHGGRLKLGPDGKLYATAGDASSPEIAQDTKILGGKILRLNLDGSVPEDNPFPHSYVYSYGHRNPQGITWTQDGTMYASEHGQSANDEINEIKAGQNYGWPIIEGPEKQSGLVSPLFTSGDGNTWAPSGVAFYNGKLYVAALRGTAILEFDLETKEVKEIVNNVGRIRDVWIEEERLYFVTNNTDGRGKPNDNDDQLYELGL